MKKVLIALLAALCIIACNSNSGKKSSRSSRSSKAESVASSPVNEYIALWDEWFLLSVRSDASYISEDKYEEIMDEKEKIEGRIEGLKIRYSDYRLTQSDREILTDWLDNTLPKYGRTASRKDYRNIEAAETLADLE